MLNAFRHHCLRHSLSRAAVVGQPDLCSTPFGITACVTPPGEPLVIADDACSTPFGITACVTAGTRSALRLTLDAQRLSASLLASPSDVLQSRPPRSMLNAFRHHCLRHSRGRRTPPGRRPMLNAFRHHCLRHEEIIGGGVGSAGCSTPFGITACVTSFLIPILNVWRLCSTPFGITACVTFDAAPPFRPKRLCSTPFGITACVTIHYEINHAPKAYAQRLSASLLASHRQPGAGRHDPLMLNAFRHHCLRHLGKADRSPNLTPDAQRLSASLLASPAVEPLAVVLLQMLNAFRHHCLRHTSA